MDGERTEIRVRKSWSEYGGKKGGNSFDFSQQTCQQKTWLMFYNELANGEGEDSNAFVCSRPDRETIGERGSR